MPGSGVGPHVAVNGPLGAQFLAWESATAVAGRVLGINPFDQPNVTESKENTKKILASGLPDAGAVVHRRRDRGVRRHTSAAPTDRDRARCGGCSTRSAPTGYLAVMAYLDRFGDADVAEVRPSWPRQRPAGHLRLGPAVPALHRPVPQGRPAGRRVPADHRRGHRRPRRARPAVHLRAAAGGPGRRRPAGARRPGPAAAAGCTSPTGRPERPNCSPRPRSLGAGRLMSARPHTRRSTDPNPLRDPLDRRLPRIPEPCALVIFGVTGDLARKKLIPAIYDLANRGLLPPGFVVLGFARRDWGDGDFETMAKEAAQEHARTPWREEVWARLGRQHQVRAAARSTTTPPSTSWPSTLDELRDTPRHPGQRRVLPVHPAGGVPGRAQADAAHRDGRQRRSPAAGAGSWWRSRSAHDLPRPRELNELVDDVFTAPGRVPHRPLPGQGDGAEHPRAALRQRPVRAGVELPVRRLGADHHGRGRRHRHPGRLLRHRRRRPRRAAEPPDAAARAGRDGGADQLRRRRDPHREAQGAAGHHAAERHRHRHRPRPVPAGLGRRRARGRLPRGGGRAGRLHHRDLRGGQARHPEPPLGRRAVLHPGRQADGPPGHRDRGAVQEGAAPAVPGRRRGAARPQPARHPRPARRGRHAEVRLEGARHHDGGPRHHDGLPVRRGVHRVEPRGVRAARARRAHRRQHAVPGRRRGRGELAGRRPAGAGVGRQDARSPTGPASGARAPPTRCSPATAHWRGRDPSGAATP